jgi:hypothetical protein
MADSPPTSSHPPFQVSTLSAEAEATQHDETLRPRLLASTGDTYCCSIAETLRREQGDGESSESKRERKPGQAGFRFNKKEETNYFKDALWYVNHLRFQFSENPLCESRNWRYECYVLWLIKTYRSADGTTIVTHSADNHLRTFILYAYFPNSSTLS